MKKKLYIDNWGALIFKNEAKWVFGDLTGDRLLQTIDFLRALHSLGIGLFGEGVGTIHLKYPRPHPTKAKEIMIVSLANEYGMVISDPLVTTRMISRESINMDQEILDQMRSILAGAASVIYSKFYSAEFSLDPTVVDSIFKEAVQAVTLNNELVVVDNGECSFSAMTIEELLFFHALLRDLFETYIATYSPGPAWGIIQNNTGTPVYLEFNTPMDSALISAFVSVIINYTNILFSAKPSRLVFGGASVSSMDFVVGHEHSMILNNPQKLFHLQLFVKEWIKTVPLEVKKELSIELTPYFASHAIREHEERLKRLEFHRMVNIMTHMGIRRARAYKLPED